MTKKDLFDGLNHIDEKIIEEAAEPVRIRKKSHKKLKKMAISTRHLLRQFLLLRSWEQKW